MQTNALLTLYAEFSRGSDYVAHEKQEKRLTKKLRNYLFTPKLREALP